MIINSLVINLENHIGGINASTEGSTATNPD
jgi:hypothetical protein